MNTQNRFINDILSTYNNILENKRIVEATDVYDYVDFKDNVVRDSKPSRDNINIVLLQDIETAAKKAGIKVDITTAVSGHDGGTLHETGNAVDIAQINGIGSDGATNSTNGNAKFRELGNKLKDALVSMGYVWNTESGNPKAVLWQTNIGGNHFNHVHISNTTSTPSSASTESNQVSSKTNDVEFERDPIISAIGNSLVNYFGIKESKKVLENIKRIKNLL